MNKIYEFSRRYREAYGKPLDWARAFQHGCPYRGDPIVMSDAAFAEVATEVTYFQSARLDTAKPEEAAVYAAIMDAVYAGWFVLVNIRRFCDDSRTHALEWIERYMEIPAKFLPPVPKDDSHATNDLDRDSRN